MKKITAILITSIFLQACTLDSDGEFVSSGSDSIGTPGYDSSPAYLAVKVESPSELACEGSLKSILSNEEYYSFKLSSGVEHELMVIQPDFPFIIQADCIDDNLDEISLSAMGSHYLGVDQGITISALTSLASAYYDFYQKFTDTTGQEYVFIQSSKKAISEHFGIDDINSKPDFSSINAEGAISNLTDEVWHGIILGSFMTLQDTISPSIPFNEFLGLAYDDLASDGKLDGMMVTDSETTELSLEFSGVSYNVDSYTYINTFLDHVADSYGYLFEDSGVRAAFFNLLDNKSSERAQLVRNEDVVLIDSAAPVITSLNRTYSNGIVEFTAVTKDDFLLSTVSISFGSSSYQMTQVNSETWVLRIELENEGLQVSDLNLVDLNSRDYYSNLTSESYAF